MKAVSIHEDGGPEVLRYEDVPDPEPGAGEVLVGSRGRRRSTTSTSGCARAFLRCRSPGSSARTARRRRGLGEGRGFAGERVVINPGMEHGELIYVIGEHMRGDPRRAVAVPHDAGLPARASGISFEDAAAFPLVYETAYRMLVTKARCRRASGC